MAKFKIGDVVHYDSKRTGKEFKIHESSIGILTKYEPESGEWEVSWVSHNFNLVPGHSVEEPMEKGWKSSVLKAVKGAHALLTENDVGGEVKDGEI